MVIAEDFVWLHFPKCAGSSVEKLLRQKFHGRPDVEFDVIDPSQEASWHDTIVQREQRDPKFSRRGKRIICNIRRLPSWIVSMVHFERQRSNQHLTPRTMLEKGEFVNWRGRRGKADRFAERYSQTEVTHWIRIEHLAEDFRKAFGAAPEIALDRKVNKGRFTYIRAIHFWFTPEELAALYAANPIWAAIERQVYGNLLDIS
jgi:hypothetical protein